MENFEPLLVGGHPNSLGRTIEVVEIILKDRKKLADLIDCYNSTDEVVRLRVSNAVKRVATQNYDWLLPYLDKLVFEISRVNQPSTQWTLTQLYKWYEKDLNPKQKEEALRQVKYNLEHHDDWIVQNTTIDTLSEWAKDDEQLREWLKSPLEVHLKSPRKSVANRAKKMHEMLYGS